MARRKITPREYVQPYDAVHRPPLASEMAHNSLRLLEARDSHVYGYRQSVVAAYSHYADPVPNPIGVAMLGLADDARRIEAITDHKDAHPFPGVRIGPLPSFSRSPNTNPVIGHHDPFRYTANRWG